MNIENIRNTANVEPNGYVLHIGEQNLKYWLDSYKNSRFSKVFWTSTNFYTRGYNITSLEQATVTTYQNPWYYFLRCRDKGDGNVTNGLDDSYASDFDFRFAFDTNKIKALVIDEDPNKREDIKLFLSKAQNVLGFISPDIIYVRDGLDYLIDNFAAQNKIEPSYMFDANLVQTLNAQGNHTCTYHVYTRDKK